MESYLVVLFKNMDDWIIEIGAIVIAGIAVGVVQYYYPPKYTPPPSSSFYSVKLPAKE